MLSDGNFLEEVELQFCNNFQLFISQPVSEEKALNWQAGTME